MSGDSAGRLETWKHVFTVTLASLENRNGNISRTMKAVSVELRFVVLSLSINVNFRSKCRWEMFQEVQGFILFSDPDSGCLLRPRPHYAGEIWKRCFHSENASNVFRPYYAGEVWKRNNHRSFWICVWGRLGQGNHMIIVTSSFSKSSVFKLFSVHTKTQSRRFQIPPVWRAFSKSSAFVTD